MRRILKRVLAIAVCVLLLAAFAFSSEYIITKSDHHCAGDSCEICHEISVCMAFFAVLSGVFRIAPLWVLVWLIAIFSSLSLRFVERELSLVNLKVKLTT